MGSLFTRASGQNGTAVAGDEHRGDSELVGLRLAWACPAMKARSGCLEIVAGAVDRVALADPSEVDTHAGLEPDRLAFEIDL